MLPAPGRLGRWSGPGTAARRRRRGRGLTPVVERLSGYDAVLVPAALSAGERQLVALTRAYLSPARLVVLDEATCHLDAAAEERAERAFAARPGSLIVIAHRMTSARRARRVLLLDGTQAWIGTHEELLVRCGRTGIWTATGRQAPAPPGGRLVPGLHRRPRLTASVRRAFYRVRTEPLEAAFLPGPARPADARPRRGSLPPGDERPSAAREAVGPAAPRRPADPGGSLPESGLVCRLRLGIALLRPPARRVGPERAPLRRGWPS